MTRDRVWTVLIADDDALVCEALADLVASDPAFEVVGVANDAEEAIRLGYELKPDVAIVDVRMPKGGGQLVAEKLATRALRIKVLAISAEVERHSEREMLAAGAVKYMTKGVFDDQLIDVLRDVATGRVGR